MTIRIRVPLTPTSKDTQVGLTMSLDDAYRLKHGIGSVDGRVAISELLTTLSELPDAPSQPSTSAQVPPVCAHDWLPETQYRNRRCKHCGAHPFEDALWRLRRRVHVHKGSADGGPQPSDTCYGSYETCGEHHVHSTTCGGRSLVCGYKEDRDAIAILEWVEARLKESR